MEVGKITQLKALNRNGLMKYAIKGFDQDEIIEVLKDIARELKLIRKAINIPE